ncbi:MULTISPECIES: DrmB family protein [unclassified Kitasatospora]|uniref:DrmB family protein n=1 Tax=unclassified Kitasatospora TaxID=2633591 RepID=UPI0038234256
MERILHDLRLSETITPFGVGAVVDVLGESLIAPDTSWWDRKRAPEISCDRLLARLGAGVLRQAPAHAGRAAKDTDHLLYWRFPAWRFCEQCTRLSKVTGRKNGRWINKCDCGGALVPMRYVAVCRKGSHIQDIPWFKWAHRGTDGGVTEVVRHCRAFTELKFVRSMRHGEGLAALRVHCSACKRSRPLSDLTGEDSLHRDYVRCDGTQPWEEPKPGEVCDHRLVAVQRGATGNYIAERLSALDIPEERPQSAQVTERIRGHLYFDKVVADNGGPQAEMVAGWIAGEVGVTAEEVLRVAAGDDDSADTPLLDLKDGEWAAFLGKLEAGRDDGAGDFVVDGWKVPAGPKWPSSLTSHLVNVGQVRRVREVRALRGFRRHDAEADLIPADLGPDRRRMPVYPAVEVFGEGIFLRFDEERLSHWENLPKVRDRAEILVDRRAASQWAHRLDSPEPRFIALHTIAHLLIRRLAFASGYASAALQERVYANSDRADRTAGILIYTAAGDAQGTLGGLVRLGATDKLLPLLLAALNDADVCSNDPVCIESDHQGSSSLNLSACHGCALVSETSCETANRLLDRQLVLGGRDVPGLLEAVLDEARRGAIV